MNENWQHMTPALWECKDYADGWICFPIEEDAVEYQRETGCMVRVYFRPPVAQQQGAANVAA